MAQVRKDVITQIRALIKSDVHQTIEKLPDSMSFLKDSDVEEHLALHRNPFIQERYTIRLGWIFQ